MALLICSSRMDCADLSSKTIICFLETYNVFSISNTSLANRCFVCLLGWHSIWHKTGIGAPSSLGLGSKPNTNSKNRKTLASCGRSAFGFIYFSARGTLQSKQHPCCATHTPNNTSPVGFWWGSKASTNHTRSVFQVSASMFKWNRKFNNDLPFFRLAVVKERYVH